MENPVKPELVKHSGGCHCAGVRFEVWASPNIYAYDCNCSICFMKSNVHFIVPANRFELTKGQDLLTTYTFNTHKAKHMFCKVCGMQSFYVPRSNPDGFGVNPRCLDQGTVTNLQVEKFDGDNWQHSMNEQLKKDVSIQSRSK